MYQTEKRYQIWEKLYQQKIIPTKAKANVITP